MLGGTAPTGKRSHVHMKVCQKLVFTSLWVWNGKKERSLSVLTINNYYQVGMWLYVLYASRKYGLNIF